MRFSLPTSFVLIGFIATGCQEGEPIDAPGIINLGATCYYNSLWQVLAHAAPFKAYIEQLPDGPAGDANVRERDFIAASKSMVAQLWVNTTTAIEPRDLFTSFRAFNMITYRPRTQSDAVEAFNYLVASLERSAVAAGVPRTDIFDTVEHEHIGCREPPMDWDEDPRDVSVVSLQLGPNEGMKNLQDLIRAHFDAQPDNRCIGGTQQVILGRTPELLVLSIDRNLLVENSGGQLRAGGKREDRVTTPLNIDLSEWVPDSHYALTGVIYHQGADNRGHYIADYFHTGHMKWVRANDRRTRAIDHPPSDSGTAYMYFYLKQH